MYLISRARSMKRRKQKPSAPGDTQKNPSYCLLFRTKRAHSMPEVGDDLYTRSNVSIHGMALQCSSSSSPTKSNSSLEHHRGEASSLVRVPHKAGGQQLKTRGPVLTVITGLECLQANVLSMIFDSSCEPGRGDLRRAGISLALGVQVQLSERLLWVFR